MNRKVLSLVLAAAMTASLAGSFSVSADDEPVVISIYQDKYEIDEALKAATAAYTELHPNVTFTVESSSSGDFYTQLKTMFASGQGPDIFSTKGSDDMAIMAEYMEDLSGQEWVEYMTSAAKEAGTVDGKVLGLPISLESYGYVYNKDLFEQAGIESVPMTITELEEVCAKLEEAGIQPVSSNYAEWYQSGMFKFSAAISRQDDPMAFIKALSDGSESLVDNEQIAELAAWIDIDAGNTESPLNTDFNTEVSDFGTGKCALMLGGSWSQSSLDDINPDLNLGLFGLPMSDNPDETRIYTSCSPFWSVNNASPAKEAAVDFLNWLAMDEEGQKYLGSEFKLIPGFTNIEVDEEAIGSLGVATQECLESGDTYGIYSSFFPDGVAESVGNTINKYAAGVIDAEAFAEELQQDWMNAVA